MAAPLKPAVLAGSPVPKPGSSDVVVRVRAAALTSSDWETWWAGPAMRVCQTDCTVRAGNVLGTDFAGEVSAIGSSVSSFTVGERVFGDLMYLCSHLAPKKGLSPGALPAAQPRFSMPERWVPIRVAHLCLNDTQCGWAPPSTSANRPLQQLIQLRHCQAWPG